MFSSLHSARPSMTLPEFTGLVERSLVLEQQQQAQASEPLHPLGAQNTSAVPARPAPDSPRTRTLFTRLRQKLAMPRPAPLSVASASHVFGRKRATAPPLAPAKRYALYDSDSFSSASVSGSPSPVHSPTVSNYSSSSSSAPATPDAVGRSRPASLGVATLTTPPRDFPRPWTAPSSPWSPGILPTRGMQKKTETAPCAGPGRRRRSALPPPRPEPIGPVPPIPQTAFAFASASAPASVARPNHDRTSFLHFRLPRDRSSGGEDDGDDDDEDEDDGDDDDEDEDEDEDDEDGYSDDDDLLAELDAFPVPPPTFFLARRVVAGRLGHRRMPSKGASDDDDEDVWFSASSEHGH